MEVNGRKREGQRSRTSPNLDLTMMMPLFFLWFTFSRHQDGYSLVWVRLIDNYYCTLSRHRSVLRLTTHNTTSTQTIRVTPPSLHQLPLTTTLIHSIFGSSTPPSQLSLPPVQMPVTKVPLPPSGTFIASVRSSCEAAVKRAQIQVSYEGLIYLRCSPCVLSNFFTW